MKIIITKHIDIKGKEYTKHRLDYKDEKNLPEAIKIMPDYKCWDSNKHVLLK